MNGYNATRTWQRSIRLQNDIVKPKDFAAISLSDIAYVAVSNLLNGNVITTHEAIISFKKAIAFEKRLGNTYQVAVRFDMYTEEYAHLTSKKFAATFEAYALTTYLTKLSVLSPAERQSIVTQLVDFFRQRKASLYAAPAQPQYQPQPQKQPWHPSTPSYSQAISSAQTQPQRTSTPPYSQVANDAQPAQQKPTGPPKIPDRALIEMEHRRQSQLQPSNT
jgi:hypothetical protein